MTFTASKKLFCIRSTCAIDGVPRVPNFSAKNTWSPPHRPLGTRRLTDVTASSAVIKCKSRKKTDLCGGFYRPKQQTAGLIPPNAKLRLSGNTVTPVWSHWAGRIL